MKRSTVWFAVVVLCFAMPAMANDSQNAQNGDPASCSKDADCDASCGNTAQMCPPEGCFIEVGGWLSSGIYGNQYGAPSNGPLTMRNSGNGYTVDQLWLFAEKKADNRGSGFDYGVRFDFMFGADAPDTQCFADGGWDGSWITSDDDNYGFALPQFYAEMLYNDLRIKIGHFYTIIGYEVVPAPGNFFYSHSYAMAIEPFTHMGVLLDYQVSEHSKVYGGWTNGWDNGWVNPSKGSTFLGGVSIDLTDRLLFTYMTSFGDLHNQLVSLELAKSKATTYLHSIIFNWQLTGCLNYVFQSDLRTDKDEGGGHTPATYRYYGINQYLLYTVNERWRAGMRVEWFRDESNIGTGVHAVNSAALTLGLNYKHSSGIVFRPEIRWDASGSSPHNFAQHFNDDTCSSQFSGGFDFIVEY